ncbi:MAG: tRNA(Met) cytidine acetyltransferase TmcA [Acidilobaceae archaeon]|nr:tRNA(Met) cytidine acetyltransferase TmcA [Acidilobaceae archaeon]
MRSLTRPEEMEKVVEEIVANLETRAGKRTVKFVKKLSEQIKKAVKNRYRILLVLSGSDPAKLGAATARALLFYERVVKKARRGDIRLLYVHHSEFEDAKLRRDVVKRALKEEGLQATFTVFEESEKYLGTTFQALVLDLVNDLKPNDVGRLVGVVEGGGIIVFQVPSWRSWPTAMTIFKSNLLVPGYEQPRHIFISWFQRKLLEHENVFVFDLDEEKQIYSKPYEEVPPERDKVFLPPNPSFPREIYELALTNDQVKVVSAMEWFYERPPKGKKKVLVITADRGRGKSCAVGIGLVGLAKQLGEVKHRVRILVTAPDAGNVQSLMELAVKAAEALGLEPRPIKKEGKIIEIQGKKFSIEYWEPYKITELGGDIVAVDEASGIHVPLLHKILKGHDRVIFAATVHGYEGAGRGFSVRFLSALSKSEEVMLKTLEMEEPIRYARGDPIERWLFDTLLLDAEPPELDETDLEDIKTGNLEYVMLEPEKLFQEERTLRQLFGIYVLAHYRNEPDDLGLLADAPHHIVRAVRTARGKKIVSALQIAVEGGIEEELLEGLLRGEKLPGNIIPDRLLKHLRVRELGKMRGWRIVRIATHPEVQGRGIGSRALRFLEEEAKSLGLDWVGSGFGANEQLLRFWLKNGYRIVHISPDRNPVSGEYTTLVVKGLRPEAQRLIDRGAREFKLKLLGSLHDTYFDLEVEVARQMLSQDPKGISAASPRLTAIQRDRLLSYLTGFMTYEAVNDVIAELARTYWHRGDRALSEEEERALIAKTLQGKPWEEVEEELGTRMQRALSLIREAVRKMALLYLSLEEKERAGVSAEELGGDDLYP